MRCVHVRGMGTKTQKGEITMTLEQIEALDREFLIPSDVAPILGTTSYAITTQVREDKQNGINSFPFPTIKIGNRVKIPRKPFLNAMKGD